jgi:hypothetical protein
MPSPWNQPTTPTHPPSSTQMTRHQTTPTTPTSHAAQDTPTSGSAKTSSPPQSATVLRYRRMAQQYRDFAETLRLSGDIMGWADATAKARSEDGKAHRLQSKNANQHKCRAERSAEKKVKVAAAFTKHWAARNESKNGGALKPVDNIPERRTPSPPEGRLPNDSASPEDRYHGEKDSSERTRPSSPLDVPAPVLSTSTQLSSRDSTLLHSLKAA